MTQEHPITPTPDLIVKWASSMCGYYEAAQWGADQELEACVEWFDNQSLVYHRDLEHTLRAARRPTPPSLKEQALKALTAIEGDFNTVGDRADTIRRALEALDD
jgi:hypothetical protein